ncbi:MAG: hypothetical protein E6G28_07420, partial [Actinobacteria bacterium]
MDRSSLRGFVDELAASERFRAFADAFPADARVSEAALPLVLATLFATLGTPLVCLFPEDEHARDAADAIAWYVDPDAVGLFPSRGVQPESGLEPPPHLVGERARGIEVLAGGGLLCASALALAEGVPPPPARPVALRLAPGVGLALEELVESLSLAGYERGERADERGQIAVRGGIVDIFPSTGREPLRVEFLGDEIEQVRAFSPFTQRTLHQVERAVIQPAAERRRDLVGPDEDRKRRSSRSRSRVSPSSTRSLGRRRTRSRPSARRSRHAGSRKQRTSSRAWSGRVDASSSRSRVRERRSVRRG